MYWNEWYQNASKEIFNFFHDFRTWNETFFFTDFCRYFGCVLCIFQRMQFYYLVFTSLNNINKISITTQFFNLNVWFSMFCILHKCYSILNLFIYIIPKFQITSLEILFLFCYVFFWKHLKFHSPLILTRLCIISRIQFFFFCTIIINIIYERYLLFISSKNSSTHFLISAFVGIFKLAFAFKSHKLFNKHAVAGEHNPLGEWVGDFSPFFVMLCFYSFRFFSALAVVVLFENVVVIILTGFLSVVFIYLLFSLLTHLSHSEL